MSAHPSAAPVDDPAETPPAADAAPGELPHGSDGRLPFRWGRLRVLERVHQARSATVYRARDPLLQTDVLLTLRHATIDAEVRRDHRLVVDARRLALVRHPHCLAVHGAAIERQRAGYWTDAPGPLTLDMRLSDDGPLPAVALLQLALELGQALHALHAAAIVHGGLRPEAVCWSTPEGPVVLREPQAPLWLDDQRADPLLHGVLPYLAPEQRVVRPPPAGPEADTFALGALLLLAATAQRPDTESAWKALGRRNELPTGFHRLLRQLLTPDSAARPDVLSTIATSATSLATVLSTAERPPGRARDWLGLAVGALAAALLAAVVLWQG